MDNLIRRTYSLVGKIADKMKESRKAAKASADDQLFNVTERNNQLYVMCGGIAVVKCDAEAKASEICYVLQKMRKAQRNYSQVEE